MKIYLIEDNRKNIHRWGFYLGAVVVAENSDDAKSIHPYNYPFIECSKTGRKSDDWVDNLDEINVTEIGEANINQLRGVVMSSYVGD